MIFVQRGDEDDVTGFKNVQSACTLTRSGVFFPSVGGRRAVLSEAPAGRARGPSGRCGEGKHRHRDRGLQTALRWGHLH